VCRGNMECGGLQKILVTLFLLLPLWDSGHVSAQARPDDVAACRAIRDDVSRLACYDRAASSLAAPSGEAYQDVDFSDLAADFVGLRGRRIAITGRIVLGTTPNFTRDGIGQGGVGIMLNLADLPPALNKTLVDKCSFTYSGDGCRATVRGQLLGERRSPTLDVHAVEIR
jgi:hypothetical protein